MNTKIRYLAFAAVCVTLSATLVGEALSRGSGGGGGGHNPVSGQDKPDQSSAPQQRTSGSVTQIMSELAQARQFAARVRAQSAALRAKVEGSTDARAAARSVASAAAPIQSELRQLRAISQRLDAQSQ